MPQRVLFLGRAEGSTCWLRVVDRDLEGVRSSRDSKRVSLFDLIFDLRGSQTINLVFTFFFFSFRI